MKRHTTLLALLLVSVRLFAYDYITVVPSITPPLFNWGESLDKIQNDSGFSDCEVYWNDKSSTLSIHDISIWYFPDKNTFPLSFSSMGYYFDDNQKMIGYFFSSHYFEKLDRIYSLVNAYIKNNGLEIVDFSAWDDDVSENIVFKTIDYYKNLIILGIRKDIESNKGKLEVHIYKAD